MKRKIRDRLQDAGEEIFVQSDDNKKDGYSSLRERADACLPSGGMTQKTLETACKKWFDVRAFGQLFAFKGGKKTKIAGGEEPGDSKGVSIGIRGPVSIHPAFSVETVSVTSTQITKSVNSEGDGSKRGSDTMGMKHRVDSAVYAFYGSMNPQLADKTGFSDADAEAVKSVLPKLFENDSSSSRPDGSMEVLKVFWWMHNCPAGQYSSAKVHRSLTVNPDGSVKLEKLAGLAPEIIDGF